MTIRKAAPTDVGRLVQFNVAMAAETESLVLDIDVVRRGVTRVISEEGHGFYLVAEVAGVVAGGLLVTYEWSDWRDAQFWWIQSVFVAPEFRRQGVFLALVNEVRAQAWRQGGVCGLRLYVHATNDAAREVYARLGFATTHYEVLQAAAHPGL
jgi:GNAT superfamily N-acetyltransferase